MDAATFVLQWSPEYQRTRTVECRLMGSRPSLAGALAIKRQDFETFSPLDTHRTKMPLIQAQYRVDIMSFRQDHNRCVSQSDGKVSIAIDDFFGAGDISGCR
jgi:hypothetical protein